MSEVAKPEQETGDLEGSISLSGSGEVIIKMEKGKFYYKGEEVTDAHQVYERFHEWLQSAEKTKI